MKRNLYFKLACVNLWKNKQSYMPYLLAATMLVFVQYTFGMLTYRLDDVMGRDAATAAMVMYMGYVVVAIFSGIFLFYANSFLIKRRKKELGLYGILGMEKKHIGRVLFHETVLSALISLAIGLLLGIVLGKLMLLIAAYMMRSPVPQVNTFSPEATGVTLVLFAIFFGITLIYNLLQVHLSKPIELLQGGQTGEKEPKTRWVMAVLGAICMGGGYYLAQIVDDPAMAFVVFFLAVILVIIGTYLLFITGSIAVLKILKNNKRIYYKSRNFITISGMLYRMKQNAAGLASVCILSTMVMVTVGSTVALYSGIESMLENYQAQSNMVSLNCDFDIDDEAFTRIIHDTAKEYNLEVENLHVFHKVQTLVHFPDVSRNITLVLLEDYNKNAGTSVELAEDEAMFCQAGRDKLENTNLIYGDKTLTIKEQLSVIPWDTRTGYGYTPSTYLVVRDKQVAQAIYSIGWDSDEILVWLHGFSWDLLGTEADKIAFGSNLSMMTNQFMQEQRTDEAASLYFSTASTDYIRNEWYGMYGGLLFLGLFLGMVFLMATALIIYFKQVSEGYQDHDRFIILQKVGMSRKEGKATVRRQILTVFFLPLLVAACHMAGAMNLIVNVLGLFQLNNATHIWQCMLLTAAVFGVLYFMVYQQTAKTYYKLVRC